MTRRERPLIEPGRLLREYTPVEAAALAAQWLAVFGANGFGSGSREYLWHVFSFAAFPVLSLKEARDQYELETCAEYIVLSDDKDVAFLTDQRPTASSLSDWFVFPPNLAWTMAFTHEDGWLGPYFARHPQYAALNAKNLALLDKQHADEQARLRKQGEIEIAKKRGWA
jgi:hypothetical protein